MSTTFASVDEAKRFAAAMAGLNPDTVVFEEVPGLRVSQMGDVLLKSRRVSKETKMIIRDQRAAQKGFKFMTPKGEAKIVIGPFRDGFDCWAVGDNGYAMRF